MARALLVDKATSDKYSSDEFSDFITELFKGNVLLMIGKAFEANRDQFEGYKYSEEEYDSLYGYILKSLNKTFSCDAMSFSELDSDEKFSIEDEHKERKKCNIHKAIINKITDAEFSLKDVSPHLLELIKTGLFRFVFTTTFDPLVEIAMKEQWYDIEIKNIYSHNTEDQDINDEDDLEKPTVFYLFGKAYSDHNFVATDIDALETIEKWLQRSPGSNLIKATSQKYILALGCDHDDWLFRIIWYLIKGKRSNLRNGVVSDYCSNSSLERFLIRNKILIQNNSEVVVRKIISEVNKREEQKRWKDPNSCDVFISYSRKDGHIAESLYEKLKRSGINVWYDKINLGGRGEPFMKKIKDAILKSKIAVPIMTNTISQQVGENHPYREEWKSIEYRRNNSGLIDFCIPLVDNTYDIYAKNVIDDIPDVFLNADFSQYDPNELDLDEFVKKIKEILSNRKR